MMFVEEISTWLKENGFSHDDDDGDVDKNDENVDENDVDKNAMSECQYDVNPEDSVSNVQSKRSSRRSYSRSGMSSTASACLKAKAEKAALMEKAVALQKRHELEAQEEKLRLESDKLRKIKEQLDIDAQIAAAAARLSVLEGSDVGGKSSSNGMNSYVSKGLKVQKLEFNPSANEFVPKRKILALDQHSTAPPVVFKQHVQPKVNVQTQPQDQIQHGASKGMDNTFRSQSQPNTEMFHTTTSKHQPQNVLAASTAAPLRSVAAQEQQLPRFQNGHSLLQNTAEHDVICGIMQK